MPSKFDRFFNPKDGTYANVPIVPVHIEHFRGKRFFNNDVLIGNWYEDRSKVCRFQSKLKRIDFFSNNFSSKNRRTNHEHILKLNIRVQRRISSFDAV